MLLTEFDQKKHDKNMWQEGYNEGHESGYNEGREEIIVMMIKRGKTPKEIANFIGEDVEVINNILRNKSN